LTTRVLLGLLLGLAAGAVVAATRHPALLALLSGVEPVGTLWLNALRMTVIPLVMSLLVSGLASASEAAAAGRVGRRTLLVFAVMLGAAAAFTAVVTPLLLAWFPIDRATAAAFRSTLPAAEGAPAAVLDFSAWITSWVPANPIEAAAAGAMLPLVVFSVILGLAVTRLSAAPREQLLSLVRAVRDAMMVIVGWVLELAPIGVFALVLPLGAGAGVGALGALGYYVVLLSALSVLVTLALYPATALLAGVSVRKFARAVAPAQVVAFSTRSSLATLPAMLDSAQVRLGLPPAISGLVLPLAVSLMRITTPLKNLAAAIFAAALLGVDLSPAQLAAGTVVSVITSLGSIGLPGQAAFIGTITPIFLVMGVPLEILGLLLAVETIPDSFGTAGNVTADVAATAMIARGDTALEDILATIPEGAPAGS
jgi:proton glutamate symport protein